MACAWAACILFVAAAASAKTYPPQVAGAFYPASPAALSAAVDGFLANISTSGDQGELVAALVPHAGYEYSGATAGLAYARLKGRRYETVIVLGTGHHVAIKGAATIGGGELATPLGAVPIDQAAIFKLLKDCPLVQDLPEAFKGEHSVEVQLPFLQRTLAGPFKVVPLLMNSDDPTVSRRVGEALAKLIRPGKSLLIVSSDLSHYPDSVSARAVDQVSLAALTGSDDPELFWLANRLLMRRGPSSLVCTYCGESGVLAADFAMRTLQARARFLAYLNSGELPNGDASRAVGYAAVLWLRGLPAPPPPKLGDAQRATLLALARQALKDKLERGEDPKSGLWRDPALGLPAAVFVTLRRRDVPRAQSLRGCVGSLTPDLPLAEAVQVYAMRSALEDRRFPPVMADELAGLSIEVSKLSPFRRVANAEAVQKGQGVLAIQGTRSGLFLPQVWEDIPDKTAFLEELCAQKAGLPRDCWKDPRTELQVFDAEAFEEKEPAAEPPSP